MAQTRPHKVLLFVADGLRPSMVNERTAPTMAALMQRGVRQHLNLTGNYLWGADASLGPDGFRPLRSTAANRPIAAAA